MKLYLDCYPCVLRHALEVARRTTTEEHVRYNIMKGALRELQDVPEEATPPEITARIHRIIRKESGIPDPYQEIKRRDNESAMKRYPRLKDLVAASVSPLLTATKLAIAGNIIDSGASGGDFDIDETIESVLRTDLVGDGIDRFDKEVTDASQVLYVGDNAGEIVFDRILIEEILNRSGAEVTFVGRGKPILNDATLDDARLVGIDTVARVIENGYDAPATILEKASPELREAWTAADLIIAKGQGNYESLSAEDGNLYLLLKIKCPTLARDIGYPVGSNVLRRTDTVQTDMAESGRGETEMTDEEYRLHRPFHSKVKKANEDR